MIFFRAPKFWYKDPSFFLKIFLKPLSWLYSFVVTKRYFLDYKYKSNKAFVIAIGAVTIGGSGKTVVTKSICEILKKKGRAPAILSRGYGSNSKNALLVDNSVHSYKDVGDEPLLLSKMASVFVGKDREKSAKLAEKMGFDCFVLDDGITQKYLQPNRKVVVIDIEQKFGNGEMLPLGPNRLDFEKIKTDINAVIVLGKAKNLAHLNLFANIPVLFGRLESDFSGIKNKKIIAFCGIGYPQKFFTSLKGFEVVKTFDFPDHYPFSENDIETLINKAKELNAQLVTTEKDFVRVPEKYKKRVTPVPIKIVWDSAEMLDSLLS